jgi:hypothetical protein
MEKSIENLLSDMQRKVCVPAKEFKLYTPALDLSLISVFR